jgi:hypothetical protein
MDVLRGNVFTGSLPSNEYTRHNIHWPLRYVTSGTIKINKPLNYLCCIETQRLNAAIIKTHN